MKSNNETAKQTCTYRDACREAMMMNVTSTAATAATVAAAMIAVVSDVLAVPSTDDLTVVVVAEVVVVPAFVPVALELSPADTSVKFFRNIVCI